MPPPNTAGFDADGNELTIKQRMVDPLTLIPHPGNPRVHNDNIIAESLQHFGQYQTPTVNDRTGQLIRGHGTVKNFIKVYPGRLMQVSVVDKTPEDATRMLLMDNASSDKAHNEPRLLAELLGTLPDLDYTGIDPGELELLLESLNADLDEFPDYSGKNDTDDDKDKPGVEIACPACGHTWTPDVVVLTRK